MPLVLVPGVVVCLLLAQQGEERGAVLVMDCLERFELQAPLNERERLGVLLPGIEIDGHASELGHIQPPYRAPIGQAERELAERADRGRRRRCEAELLVICQEQEFFGPRSRGDGQDLGFQLFKVGGGLLDDLPGELSLPRAWGKEADVAGELHGQGPGLLDAGHDELRGEVEPGWAVRRSPRQAGQQSPEPLELELELRSCLEEPRRDKGRVGRDDLAGDVGGPPVFPVPIHREGPEVRRQGGFGELFLEPPAEVERTLRFAEAEKEQGAAELVDGIERFGILGPGDTVEALGEAVGEQGGEAQCIGEDAGGRLAGLASD